LLSSRWPSKKRKNWSTKWVLRRAREAPAFKLSERKVCICLEYWMA
jgi:hypothetical protein